MDFKQLPHVLSALQHPHEIVLSNEDMLVIFCTVSNVYVAECNSGLEEKAADIILKRPVIRLQTSNKKLQSLLVPHFKHNYACEQAVYSADGNCCDSNLKPLEEKDLEYTAQTYEMAEYITQLYERNRLFGYYEKDNFIGYVAFHIDETVGALFVKPEYRRAGYGEKIMTAAFNLYSKINKNVICFSQILDDNESSIRLHKKMGCIFSDPVFWVYDEEYRY